MCEGFFTTFNSSCDIVARSCESFAALEGQIQRMLLIHSYFRSSMESLFQIFVAETTLIAVIILPISGFNSAYDDMPPNSEVC